MNRRNIISLLLVLLMLFTLAACSNSTESDTSQPTTSDTSQPSTSGTTGTSQPSSTNTAQASGGIGQQVESAPDTYPKYSTLTWLRGNIEVFTAEDTGIGKKTPDNSIVVKTGNIVSCFPNSTGETAWVGNVYECLFSPDCWTGELKPVLATDWYYDNDGNFHILLRNDVIFHDGTKMTSEDVLFTFEYISNDTLSNLNDLYKNIDFEKSYAQDDYHVVVVFKNPIGCWIETLGNTYASIVSKDFVTNAGDDYDYLSDDAGTGAYRIVETVTGVSQSFVRFDDWWGGTPIVDAVTAINYRDTTVMAIEFENRDADITLANDFAAVQRVLSGELTDMTMYNIIVSRMVRLALCTMGTHNPVLADLRLREAFAIAFDREELVMAAYGNNVIAKPPTTVRAGGIQQELIQYDPERAIALLAECGYGPNNPLTLKMMATDAAVNQAMAEYLVMKVAEVGINIDLTIATNNAQMLVTNSRADSAEYDIVLYANSTSPSPEIAFFAGDAYGKDYGEFRLFGAINDYNFHAAYEELLTCTDSARREQLEKILDTAMWDQYIFVPLVATSSAYMVQGYIDSFDFLSGYHFKWSTIKFK